MRSISVTEMVAKKASLEQQYSETDIETNNEVYFCSLLFYQLIPAHSWLSSEFECHESISESLNYFSSFFINWCWLISVTFKRERALGLIFDFYLLAEWFWASYLTSISFSFIFLKPGLIKVQYLMRIQIQIMQLIGFFSV